MPDPAAISAEQMKLVLDVSRLLVATDDLDVLLKRIAEAATSLLSAERASIFLHDAAAHQLWTKIALGAGGEIRVPDTAGIVGHVLQTNRLLNIPDAYADPRFNREVDRKTGFRTRNLLTLPLPDITDHPLGVLQIVNKVGGAFGGTDEAMVQLLADQAGVAIQRYRLQQAAIESVELRREMDLARKVQERLIPQHAPDVHGYEAVGWSLPASVTGGDAFDLWRLPAGQLGVFLGDASGHGLAPALVVSQARTLLRSLSELICDPRWLLRRVNARLVNDLDPDRFVTCFTACLAPGGELTWFSAGHGGVFVRRSPGEELITLDPCAPPVGVLDDLAGEPTVPLLLEPGGMLVVLSDGIFEAYHKSGSRELYGVPRVAELLDRCRDQSPAQLLETFRAEMRDWQGNEDPADDQTVVIVRRTE